MAEWKQKALALFPDLLPDMEEPDANIYTLFFELLPRCIAAHEANDAEELGKIYGYVEWCSWQPEKDLIFPASLSALSPASTVAVRSDPWYYDGSKNSYVL